MIFINLAHTSWFCGHWTLSDAVVEQAEIHLRIVGDYSIVFMRKNATKLLAAKMAAAVLIAGCGMDINTTIHMTKSK